MIPKLRRSWRQFCGHYAGIQRNIAITTKRALLWRLVFPDSTRRRQMEAARVAEADILGYCCGMPPRGQTECRAKGTRTSATTCFGRSEEAPRARRFDPSPAGWRVVTAGGNQTSPPSCVAKPRYSGNMILSAPHHLAVTPRAVLAGRWRHWAAGTVLTLAGVLALVCAVAEARAINWRPSRVLSAAAAAPAVSPETAESDHKARQTSDPYLPLRQREQQTLKAASAATRHDADDHPPEARA